MLVYLGGTLAVLALLVCVLVLYCTTPSSGRHAYKPDRTDDAALLARERTCPDEGEYSAAQGDLYEVMSEIPRRMETRPYVMEVWRKVANDPEQTTELASFDWGDEQDHDEKPRSAPALVAA